MLRRSAAWLGAGLLAGCGRPRLSPEQLRTLSGELSKLRSEVAYYRRELADLRNRSYGLDQMIGESVAMQRLKQQIMRRSRAQPEL